MPGLLNYLSDKTGYLLDELFAFISAPRCPICDSILEDIRSALCPVCDSNLTFIGDGPVCLFCRSPKAIGCGCQDGRKYKIPELYYWSTYTDNIRELIHQFKFDGQLKIGEYLIRKALAALAERIGETGLDLAIPIPMLARDKRKRTYNQTELIADIVARNLGISSGSNALKKVRKTRLQAKLGRDERWGNIKDAFTVESSDNIRGRAILLVDDIVTTGATSWEAAKALYAAGAKSVSVFAIASSHLDDDIDRGLA